MTTSLVRPVLEYPRIFLVADFLVMFLMQAELITYVRSEPYSNVCFASKYPPDPVGRIFNVGLSVLRPWCLRVRIEHDEAGESPETEEVGGHAVMALNFITGAGGSKYTKSRIVLFPSDRSSIGTLEQSTFKQSTYCPFLSIGEF